MFGVRLLGFYFREKMEGSVQRAGERFDRTFRFELDVHAPSILGFATTAVGECAGRVHIDGLAKDAPATGRIEISPLRRQTIRYVLDFTGRDGARYRFDGSKRVTLRRHIVGWTTLPGHVFDAQGSVWGDALLRFPLRRELRKLVASFVVGPRAELAGDPGSAGAGGGARGARERAAASA
jgi:hypothetical protein